MAEETQMAADPGIGPYSVFAEQAIQIMRAQAVVVSVMGGIAGDGYALTIDVALQNHPRLIIKMAEQLEATAAALRRTAALKIV